MLIKIFISSSNMCYFNSTLSKMFLGHTRVGLNLRAVGESPATADAAGINVTKYKYISTEINGITIYTLIMSVKDLANISYVAVRGKDTEEGAQEQ